MLSHNHFSWRTFLIIDLVLVLVKSQLTTTWADRPDLRMGSLKLNLRSNQHIRCSIHSLGCSLPGWRDIQDGIYESTNIRGQNGPSRSGIVRIRELFALPDQNQCNYSHCICWPDYFGCVCWGYDVYKTTKHKLLCDGSRIRFESTDPTDFSRKTQFDTNINRK